MNRLVWAIRWTLLLLGSALMSFPVAAQISDAARIAVAERLHASTVTVVAGRGSGSGFIVGKERWVVTNAHVAEAAARGGRLGVRFSKGDVLPARLLAFDPDHDLAVAEVLGEVPGPALALGDSGAVRVGESVLAFGSPFGLEGTLTQGIVSARRDFPGIGNGSLRDVIQTDAPINPGNSGGPLVNARGEVVGVNTAILSRGGGSNGIGFAVPASYVRELLQRVREARTAEVAKGTAPPATPRDSSEQDIAPTARGWSAPKGFAHGERSPARGAVWLGIYGEDIRTRGLRGVRILHVVPGGPAHEAGLRGAQDPAPRGVRLLGLPWTGHILLSLDGEPIAGMADLVHLLSQRRPGDVGQFEVIVAPGNYYAQTKVRFTTAP